MISNLSFNDIFISISLAKKRILFLYNIRIQKINIIFNEEKIRKKFKFYLKINIPILIESELICLILKYKKKY